MKNKSIGSLIQEKAEERNLSVIEMAELIGCERNNIYNIYKRDDISIMLLKKISMVLNYNFFELLANDPDLIKEEEPNTKKRAAEINSNFIDIIHDVLRELNINTSIAFTKLDHEYPTPDYGILGYNISFTIMDRMKYRIGDDSYIKIDHIKSNKGDKIEIVNNTIHNSTFINVPLDRVYQKEELIELLSFVFEIYYLKNIHHE